MPDAYHADDSLRYLRALGDPDRLKIVQILRAGAKSVGEICSALGSPIANVSHHLGMLKETGIVSASKKGRFVIYQLNHVVEARHAGKHVLDFGCCRVEFSEGSETPSVKSSRPEDQALLILNRIFSRAPGGSALSDNAKPNRHASGVPLIGGGRSRCVEIVNPSFEAPFTPFFDTKVAGWRKEGDPSGTGVFRNFPDDSPIPGSRFIVNADGEQLAAIGARNPGGNLGPSALFQPVAGAPYQPGGSYMLSVGVGMSSIQPPTSDGPIAPDLRFALTYTDIAGLRHEVMGRSVTPADLDDAPDRLTYLSVAVTLAGPIAAACADHDIGILISTAGNSANHAGNFIFDNVTLVIEAAPATRLNGDQSRAKRRPRTRPPTGRVS